MEGKAAEVTDRSERMALVGGKNALRIVLDNRQVMPLCDVHNGIHLAGDTCIMNHRDCFRFGGDGILDLLLIDIHGVRTDIDEDRDAAAQDEAVRR